MSRLLLVLVALLALAGPAVAAAPKADFADIEDEVMCVSCNVALNIAESPQADQQKRFIRKLVEQGRTKDEILDELIAVYGENVLASPRTDDGVGLAAFGVPIAGGVAALGLVAFLLPRWRRREPVADGTPPPSELSAEDAARLDDELREHDR